MTKYRLNIKYPIEEDCGQFFVKLFKFDKLPLEIKQGGYPDLNRVEICYDLKRYTLECPESWIEEIKDSEFEKWFDGEIYTEGLDIESDEDKRVKQWCKDTWQASQENRDLLYKGLIQHVTNLINNWTDGTYKHIKKELDKIKNTINN